MSRRDNLRLRQITVGGDQNYARVKITRTPTAGGITNQLVATEPIGGDMTDWRSFDQLLEVRPICRSRYHQ
jgi:hypothetical protein